MTASLGSLLKRLLSYPSKDAQSLAGKCRNLAAVAAVAASFGLPVWIMVSTLGGQPSPATVPPTGRASPGAPWAVVRSVDDMKVAAPQMIPAKSEAAPVMRAAIGDGETDSDVSVGTGTSALKPKPVLTDVGKGMISTVPEDDGAPVVIAH